MSELKSYVNFGGIKVRYSFLYPETAALFGRYLEKDCDTAADLEIQITPEYIEESKWLVDENETSMAFREFQSLMLKTGNELLLHDRVLFHGAAFTWNNKAWIFTAPSGTGKTTQLNHWRTLFKRDVKVINGDKPLLECKDDGKIIVHSSPWRGKERMGIKTLKAELGGIILLEQGKSNHIERMDPEDAVIPLFIEFIAYPDNKEQILAQADILDRILKRVPVWKLVNLGDEESAKMTVETLKAYLEETHGKL